MSTISYLTRIEYGEGQVSRLPEFLAALGVKRPLIATDKGLVATGLVAKIAALLSTPPTIFDGTPANPTEEACLTAHALCKESDCDGIIGLGGGSALDLAKAVRLLTGHDGPLSQYTLVAGGLGRIHSRICPMIAIPTTSGTGSEVGRAAVIITAEGRKLGIISPHMLPTLALCDPELTYGLPAGLTAATGMDAMSHCLETFMASAFNPPADAIAMDGLTRGWRSLCAAVKNGQDSQARNDMMMCALEGAMAFQKGLGAVHAITHPMGAIRSLNLHHGTLNAILMPAVLRFNRSAIGSKWEELQRFFGKAPDVAIEELNRDTGMPKGLQVLGVTGEMMEHVSHEAMKDHCHATNPRIASPEDYLAIMREAY